jgi:hypothetical protein
VNWIQMKLMKVIHNMKNILIEQFQHCLESWLIEVMICKMLLIQFISTVNTIQRKSNPILLFFPSPEPIQESNPA